MSVTVFKMKPYVSCKILVKNRLYENGTRTVNIA